MATKQEIDDQLTALRKLLAAAASSLAIEQIEAQSKLELDRRTLQRRLKNLVKSGLITKTGKTSTARYAASKGTPPADDQQLIPVSKAGAKVQAYLRKAPGARKIVGYERGFLDRYLPNETAYLTETDRARLYTVGKPNITVQEAGTYAKNVLHRLLIDLSWNSSRLEGNTYSLLDTKRLVEFGQEAEGKDRREAQMILNHKAAIEFLVQSAPEVSFNQLTILNLHALLADGLLENPESPGRLRSILIGIDGSTYHPPGVPQLIEECFRRILATASAIEDPFEQAFFVMVQLPYLQPFDDVNKRVSRLAANIPLIKANLCPLSFIDVPKETYTQATLGVYELNEVALLKDVFLWAYERSASRYAAVQQQIGEPDPFRLRHREALREVVTHVIRDSMDRKAAFKHVSAWAAANLKDVDTEPFRELVETELMALHRGNFVRYRVRPAEFEAWQEVWKRQR